MVDLDFGEERITIENIHVILGLLFYLVILRLINKILNPTPKLAPSIFLDKIYRKIKLSFICGNFINNYFRDFKKLFNGETLLFFQRNKNRRQF